MDHMEFGEFFERTWNCSEFRICTACMVCINVHAWENETAPWHHMTSHGIACFACIACDKGFFPSILISLARRHRLSQLEDLVTLRFEIVGVMEAYQSHHGIAHRNLIMRRQEIEMWLIPRNMRLKITELSSADFSFGVAWGCLAKGVGSKLLRAPAVLKTTSIAGGGILLWTSRKLLWWSVCRMCTFSYPFLQMVALHEE